LLFSGTRWSRLPVFPVLKLKSEIVDSFLQMDEVKEIKGKTVSEVYGKVSRWHNDQGVILRN
jgi:hypothetical protein